MKVFWHWQQPTSDLRRRDVPMGNRCQLRDDIIDAVLLHIGIATGTLKPNELN